MCFKLLIESFQINKKNFTSRQKIRLLLMHPPHHTWFSITFQVEFIKENVKTEKQSEFINIGDAATLDELVFVMTLYSGY